MSQQLLNPIWNNRHLLKSDMSTGSIKDAIAWISKDFSIIADSGDNPTAGGVGDRADILEEVLKHKIHEDTICWNRFKISLRSAQR